MTGRRVSFSFEDVCRASIVIALHRPDLLHESPRDRYDFALEMLHQARADIMVERGVDPVIEERSR